VVLLLKQFREREGLTQEELSKVLQLSPSAIGLYEQGRRQPNYETLIKIADHFKVSIDALFGREEKEPMPASISELEPEIREKVDKIIGDIVKLQPDQMDLAQHLIGGLLKFDEQKASATKGKEK
jgi:transcriptional regulator with XRE-family HTH domain